jgi:hypothetical protein
MDAVAPTVILINPHRQQREEDGSTDHPQRAVPVIRLNHRLNNGKDIGKRHHQHHHRGRQQRRRAGFENHKRTFKILLCLKERERQVRNRYGSVIETFAISVSLL